jgi:hypothetical protein
MRAMYTTAFSQIPPVTYQQVRNNPPLVRYVMVNDPPLVDPLAGVDLNDPNLRYSPTVLAPDLKTTYAHQYNATFERQFAGASTLRLGYVGSRTIKLLNVYPLNRAEPVPGIPLTTSTVDLRRPDQRYAEVRWVVNGGLAWYDAALWSGPRNCAAGCWCRRAIRSPRRWTKGLISRQPPRTRRSSPAATSGSMSRSRIARACRISIRRIHSWAR